MEIKGVQIYYFSGTGNSGNVAAWFSQVAAGNYLDCQLINISRIDRIHIEKPKPGNLIVFVSPIHGFNYPPIMLHFIRRFPKGNNPVVLMNTRAGMLIGRWITPGVTGIAFYISSFFLMLKGYSIKALYPVDLPSNWISVHPGLNDRTIKFMHEKIKGKIREFSLKILSGKSHFKALLEIHDLFLLPIAVMYYFAGRFIFSKTYYASADCDHCDVCMKSCPVKAIIKIDNRPYWTLNCESCMKCMSHCPRKAIETGHGYIFAYSILFSMVISGLFFTYFELFFFRIENSFLHFMMDSALYLLILVLWYRIIHYLLRFRIFERLIVYTSLTKFKFWGRRYKALKE